MTGHSRVLEDKRRNRSFTGFALLRASGSSVDVQSREAPAFVEVAWAAGFGVVAGPCKNSFVGGRLVLVERSGFVSLIVQFFGSSAEFVGEITIREPKSKSSIWDRSISLRLAPVWAAKTNIGYHQLPVQLPIGDDELSGLASGGISRRPRSRSLIVSRTRPKTPFGLAVVLGLQGPLEGPAPVPKADKVVARGTINFQVSH